MTSTTPTQTTETSTPTELLEGVQILIERMESAPEDFLRPPTPNFEYESPTPRFAHISGSLEDMLRGKDDRRDFFIHLTAEEKTALLVAYRKMMRQAFTASVIATTFDTETTPKPSPKVRVTAKTAALGAGYGNAVLKAEGSRVEYFTSNGLAASPISDEGRKLMAKLEEAIKNQ